MKRSWCYDEQHITSWITTQKPWMLKALRLCNVSTVDPRVKQQSALCPLHVFTCRDTWVAESLIEVKKCHFGVKSLISGAHDLLEALNQTDVFQGKIIRTVTFFKNLVNVLQGMSLWKLVTQNQHTQTSPIAPDLSKWHSHPSCTVFYKQNTKPNSNEVGTMCKS